MRSQTGEVGELAEIFQWRGEVKPGLPGWPEADRVHLGEELSDVLLYLVRIADRVGAASGGPLFPRPLPLTVVPPVPAVPLCRVAQCGVDLPAAALAKLEKNAEKYPADLVRGRSDKYHVYKEAARERRRAQAESVEVAEGEEGAAAR